MSYINDILTIQCQSKTTAAIKFLCLNTISDKTEIVAWSVIKDYEWYC